jgi:peptidoglycan hydrolase CwlO-like protein
MFFFIFFVSLVVKILHTIVTMQVNKLFKEHLDYFMEQQFTTEEYQTRLQNLENKINNLQLVVGELQMNGA